jgi:hypothetical protein
MATLEVFVVLAIACLSSDPGTLRSHPKLSKTHARFAAATASPRDRLHALASSSEDTQVETCQLAMAPVRRAVPHMLANAVGVLAIFVVLIVFYRLQRHDPSTPARPARSTFEAEPS